jgi:gas vesicle protein GvpL/GvpF
MSNNSQAELAVWLYAIIREGETDLPDITGVSGEQIRAIHGSGLTAAVGSVPLAEFAEEPLRSQLSSVQTAETIARSHHGVIASISNRTTAVPARLGTIYRDDTSVVSMLRERRADLATALGRLAQCTEWGVRAYVAAPTHGEAPSDADSESAPASGIAYLQRRRAALESADERRRLAGAQASEIHSALSGQANGARSYPPQPPQLTGESRAMILNATYLISDDGTSDFAAAVESLRRRHRSVDLVLTGPWPPYSFTGLPEPEATQ